MSLFLRTARLSTLFARPFTPTASLKAKEPPTPKTPLTPPADTETHTGQKFEADDYRLVRFVGREKQVNKSFAVDLIAQVPPAEAKSRVVWCDGGGGPTGHPKVFINLDSPGKHACGYCGLRFYKDAHHH